MHGNAKRVYPYWKICRACSAPFPCRTKEQAVRNRTCSPGCAAAVRAPRTRKPMSERPGMVRLICPCGMAFWRPRSWAKGIAEPHCTKACNGKARSVELVKHSGNRLGKRRPGTGLAGERSPAWKGGVTYFRKHGNYKPIKYVRCPRPFGAMARKDGYVMEHRLLVAQAIGRPLLRREVVHHGNHDPQDNRLHNLMLFTSNRDHKRYEHHGSPAPIWP